MQPTFATLAQNNYQNVMHRPYPAAPSLLPCQHCGSTHLTVKPWEGQPYVWCVCGWAWPLSLGTAPCEIPRSPSQDSGSVTRQASSRASSASEGSITPPRVPSPTPLLEADESVEQALEGFLARANLSMLFPALRDARMWLEALRSIPLGSLHNDLLLLVPHRVHRQRLIDALHSTIDIRASHKDKQGMWHKARDEGRTVYIRGISSLTDQEVREYLADHHGAVVDMRYMFDPRNNSFMGYAFVMFERKEAVDSILRRQSYPLRQGVTLMVKSSDNLVR